MDIQLEYKLLVTSSAMKLLKSGISKLIDRDELKFASSAAKYFAFLQDMGFSISHSSSTIVEYRRENIAANVYHGRHSYEIGFEIVFNDECYSLSEIIRAYDTKRADRYVNFVATEDLTVSNGLKQIRLLVLRYAIPLIQGDTSQIGILREQRKVWGQQLERETKLASIRPRAEEAFRLEHYADAAQLYDQLRPYLTAAEIKKADIAKSRAAGRGTG